MRERERVVLCVSEREREREIESVCVSDKKMRDRVVRVSSLYFVFFCLFFIYKLSMILFVCV